MPSVARILQIAPMACVLSANASAKGQLFGGKVDPLNPQRIYNVYKVLKTIYDKDPNYDGLQVRADYLYELLKKYALRAAAIVDGGGGGSVAPPTPTPDSNIYPFIITSVDFESDGVSYNNPDIVGDNLMIFINEWSQQWLTAPASFVYTATGIKIVLIGFDANTADFTIVIQKLNNG